MKNTSYKISLKMKNNLLMKKNPCKDYTLLEAARNLADLSLFITRH